MTSLKRLLTIAASALSVTACATSTPGSDGLYATPTGGAPVTANPTPYSQALVCMANHAHQRGFAPRIAVGRINDYTGQIAPEGGTRVTQGAALMAMSAFAKAGARLVERYDTSVAELELRYANSQLLGDSGEAQGLRQIHAGAMPSSDYYLVGGITELNANIRSNGQDLFAGDSVDSDPAGVFSRRLYVMNVGLDLRLIDSRTLEVVDVISYQKQIIGRELSAGVFAFFGDVVLDASAGGRSLEPVQLAVRSVIERAVVEISAQLYGVAPNETCAFDDPIGGSTDITGGVQVATSYAPTEAPYVQARSNVDRGHERRDADIRSQLRGTYQ
ncbi:transcriptional regulator [Marinicauda pacifica]|uniref:Transcriptional regulator n=1 Tax=Marinicauda pacifica TaxID=1133559 RepID=A0A4S2HDD8_9PROT|nr:holdfast anchoring protein HfaB [Marinicauda pacifica]TGY94060.1 transcriptional regulator [Marinicauda pacifica]GGE32515.1 transcriptional regulator [Marinicauda pacifica]